MKNIVVYSLLLFGWISNAQITGSLSGSVQDEKDQPIPGASVYLEGTELGTQTDFDGLFRLENIAPGSYNLIVSYVGYDTQTRYNVIVKSKGNAPMTFVLKEASEQLEEVVISKKNTISRPRETPLSTQTISAVEIANAPGGGNDVVKVAQSLPGVSPSIGGFRNDLIIRGGAPNESVYYLDGVEVPNINHFSTQGSAGGPVGMVNVSFINEVTLSASAFDAVYDNPLSGVLQFTQRAGNNRNFSGNFRLGASESGLTLEGPLFKKGKETSNTTFLMSVRRSYLQFLFKAIGLPIRPDYWDYQYKVDHKFDAYNSISVIGIGSVDDFSVEAPEEYDEEQQASLEQAPFIVQRSNTIGVTWKHRLKDNSGFMQTTLSNNRLDNVFTRYEDAENETGIVFQNDAVESETKLRYALTKFYGDWKVKSGFNAQFSDYDNTTIGRNPLDTSETMVLFESSIDFVKYGFFANATRSYMDDKLDVSVGFRMDADTFTQKDGLTDTFSPRVALSYALSDNLKLNASVGRYFKIAPYTALGFRNTEGILVNKNLDYTRSDHYVLGLQHYFSPASSVSVEGFYKRYADYQVSVEDGVSLANKGAGFEVLGSEALESVGLGRSYGAEVLFQQKLTNNFYGIFSYTWFYSEFTGFDTSSYLPSVWDSRHLASFTAGYKLSNNWELSSRYRFAGRTPFVGVDEAATLDNYPEIVLDYSTLGTQKLRTFSQLDLRIDKKWSLKKVAIDLFFEAQNILGQSSPQTPQYGLARDANGQINSPRQLTQIVSESGSFIPSIGMVLDF